MRKRTETFRATLIQEFRLVIGPDEGAPVESKRRVTVMTPASPVVSMFATPYVQRSVSGTPDVVVRTARELGLNRRYRAPQLTPNAVIHFDLAPDQELIGAADIGMAYVGIIIEYL